MIVRCSSIIPINCNSCKFFMDLSHVVDKIRETVKVSDVVSRKVRLTKKGKDFFGLCPFHREKTPSFSVNDDKHFYHCFGCGENGTAIDFVKKTQNLGFLDAVKLLAKEYNIRIDEGSAEKFKKELSLKEKIFKANELAAQWLHQNLYSSSNVEVLEYLRRRGLIDVQIKRFNLGYAPDNSFALLKHLQDAGFTLDELCEAGLAKNTGSKYICRFMKRVMFPICTTDGIIAFGGRVISPNDSPKYLNSPETVLFKKKTSFYLENIAFKKARETNTLFVVEGYTDAIAMHTIGVESTVATLGTAISEEHIKKLWNIIPVPTICMDGDQAGIAAMNKVIDIALPLLSPGFSLNFLQLPNGHDPDSLIKTHGAIAFKNLMKQVVPLSDLVWNAYLHKINIETPEGKALLKSALMDVTGLIAHVEIRSFYRSYLMRKFNSLIYATRYKKADPVDIVVINSPSVFKNITSIQRYELILAALLIKHPNLLQNLVLAEKAHTIEPKTQLIDQVYHAIFGSFAECVAEADLESLSQACQEKIRNTISESLLDYLCGKNSYFLDTMEIKSFHEVELLWLQTFDRYTLELIKEQYKNVMQNLNDKTISIASKLKLEIENMEKAMKISAN